MAVQRRHVAEHGEQRAPVNCKDHGGEVVFTGHEDDDYIARVDIALNSGLEGSLYVRYLDPDNWYWVRCSFASGDLNPTATLEKMLHPERTEPASTIRPVLAHPRVWVTFDDSHRTDSNR